MNSQPQTSLKPLLWNATHWSVITGIAYATYAQPSYGARLLDVAAIWTGIINTLLLIYLAFLVGNKEVNRLWRQQQQERKTWKRVHSTLLAIAELFVFAWAGWLWSFGIRLVRLFILQMVAVRSEQSQDKPPQARR
ncbi:hypothetical protein FSY59_24820 [Comamonas sp. Z3]|uniref:hypothetical protein n=1 Tax=Comamonas sp. Z3 TaxID=2601247 RepID=UPI0011E7CE58|nr:hypothetical protein [Comamonas sp. Z3]TYK67844.1 hypothetical protein FSY59_24820 [Comamonas sp. Z3]